MLTGPNTIFIAPAFSPDSKRLVACGQSGAVRVRDTTSGKELLDIQGHTLVAFRVAYSPDGERIAARAGIRVFSGSGMRKPGS